MLADGRHPVHLVAVDARGRTITFDLIQFFTGEAAVKAAAEDHQESPPPNDCYARNNVLAAEQIGSSSTDVPVTLWPSWRAGSRTRASQTFWITVRGGRVARMTEQYLPSHPDGRDGCLD